MSARSGAGWIGWSARGMLLGCLGACSTRAPVGTVVLKLWAAGNEGAVAAQLIGDFEATHPGIRVEVQQIPWRGAHEKLLTAVVGESTPDIAQMGNTWIAEFATIGAIQPLDSELESSSEVEQNDYFAGVWDTNVFEGKLYGIPWYVDTRLLFYRRDLLEQAGHSQPPRSWGEWQIMLQAIHERDAKRMPMFLPVNEFDALLALGLQQQEPLLRDGDRFGNFQSPGFRHALQFYVSLFQTGLAPRAATNDIGNLWDEFARGSFVFYIGGPWQIGQFQQRLPATLASSWMTAPLPGPEGPGASVAGGASLVVFEHSRNKREAWQLIEYLSRPEVQLRFYDLTGDLPPRRTTWQDASLSSDVHAKAFRDQLERVEPTPKVPEWERIVAEIAIIGERAAYGTLSVDAAVVELDARADRILDKRRWMLERAAQRRSAKQVAE
jgi:multiple sugar transport system substrate-binding protein